MNISLIGKKALVGGASGGIGKAIALQLAECGAEVTIMARNEQKLKSVLQQMNTGYDQKHRLLVTDFLDYAKHKELMSRFFEEHTVDILVNNTQGPSGGGLTNKSNDDYQQAFDLLFQIAVHTSMLALKGMKETGFGRIISVSSMTVKEPQDNLVLSNTMRTALVSWSKSLSNEVARDGITVNSIMTGFFDTDRLQQLMEQQAKGTGKTFNEIKKGRMASVPIQRLGRPEEYGYLVAFLASEYASFLTGASIPLDGGVAKGLF